MKSGTILICYGLFLIIAGLAGFLSNPEKAKTALMSGGTFGLIQIIIGAIAAKGWKPARKIGIGVCGFLTLVFSWRSIVSWMAVAGGQGEKLFAASLISTMLAASIVAIILLVRSKTATA
jgi:uncharacterized membrane protein (UPF0136 family)